MLIYYPTHNYHLLDMNDNNFIGRPVKGFERGEHGSHFSTKIIEAKEGDEFTHEVVDLFRDRKTLQPDERLGLLNGQAVITKKIDADNFREG